MNAVIIKKICVVIRDIMLMDETYELTAYKEKNKTAKNGMDNTTCLKIKNK
jgi:phage gp16-like protein